MKTKNHFMVTEELNINNKMSPDNPARKHATNSKQGMESFCQPCYLIHSDAPTTKKLANNSWNLKKEIWVIILNSNSDNKMKKEKKNVQKWKEKNKTTWGQVKW